MPVKVFQLLAHDVPERIVWSIVGKNPKQA
jgi:hypothetical protein